jgi:hypothetical protein
MIMLSASFWKIRTGYETWSNVNKWKAENLMTDMKEQYRTSQTLKRILIVDDYPVVRELPKREYSSSSSNKQEK